jgi:hypothetical protein
MITESRFKNQTVIIQWSLGVSRFSFSCEAPLASSFPAPVSWKEDEYVVMVAQAAQFPFVDLTSEPISK